MNDEGLANLIRRLKAYCARRGDVVAVLEPTDDLAYGEVFRLLDAVRAGGVAEVRFGDG